MGVKENRVKGERKEEVKGKKVMGMGKRGSEEKGRSKREKREER